MSWDVFVQDIPEDAAVPADIPDDFQPQPLGLTATEVVDAAQAVAGSIDDTDPAWPLWTGPGFDIEMDLGRLEESFALHCRGDFDTCRTVAHALLQRLGVRAFSMLDEGAIIGSARR